MPLPDPHWTVRTATEKDYPYLDQLQHKHGHEVGFLPRAAMKQKIDQGRYLLLRVRGQPAAYILSSGGIRVPYHNIQIAITEELWRQGYGTILWTATAFLSRLAPKGGITFSSRADLAANRFFRKLGSKVIGTRLLQPHSSHFMYDYTVSKPQTHRLVTALCDPDGLFDRRFHLTNVFDR